MRDYLFVDLSKKLKKRIVNEAEAHQDDWSLPTLRELAKEYKVSLVTAKKAVDILSTEGLTYSRSGVGIKVDNTVLKKKLWQISAFKVTVIFLDIFDIHGSIIGDIVHGVLDIQKKLGFQVKFIPIPSEQSLSNQLSVLKNILDEGADGVIVASRMPVGIISKLQEKNVKFVWIANNIPHEKIYSVMFDKSDMYLKIVKRITERHIKKVAFVAPSLSSEDEKIFMGLCKQAKISARIFAYDVVKKTEEVRNIAAKDTLKLLFSSDIPKLIICGGETATHGVLEAIFSKGLKISEDIYIISVLESESLPFRLSVSFDILINSFFELAREATIILHQILEGKIPEHNIKYLPVMTKTLKI